MPVARLRVAALPVAFLTFLALVACASPSAAVRRPHRVPDVISAEDISASPYHTAYEVIEALHPNWLRGRGQSLHGPYVVRVILDDQPYGTVDQLRAIQTMSISSIRWMDAPSAATRWGLGYGGGAVVLTSLNR